MIGDLELHEIFEACLYASVDLVAHRLELFRCFRDHRVSIRLFNRVFLLVVAHVLHGLELGDPVSQ